MKVKMTSAFSSIKKGLEEALAFSQGKVSKAVMNKFISLYVTIKLTEGFKFSQID